MPSNRNKQKHSIQLQAYRRESSSVRIAKIIGLTVVVSSFILGSCILASSYIQARASCDQMQTLDSILEKELMLETLQVSGIVCFSRPCTVLLQSISVYISLLGRFRSINIVIFPGKCAVFVAIDSNFHGAHNMLGTTTEELVVL